MYRMEKNGDNRIDFEFGGRFDSNEMKQVLDEFVAKAEGIQKGRMFVRITGYKLPTPGAVAVELSRLPELFGTLRKFERCAVLCDARWVQKISELESLLFPWLDIKGFDPGDEGAAQAWLGPTESTPTP